MKRFFLIASIAYGCLLALTSLHAQQPGVAIGSLTATYSSSKHGFSLNYPESWKVKDATVAGGQDVLWLTIGNEPMLLNIHKQKLERGTTAEKFARFNTYVLNWQRKTIKGSSAFVTTDGSPESKRVIHRIIIVNNGCAWMLNCIDTSGGLVDIGSRLLNDVAESIGPVRPKAFTAKPAAKPVVKVIVKPLPAPRAVPVKVAPPAVVTVTPKAKTPPRPSEAISVTVIKAKP